MNKLYPYMVAVLCIIGAGGVGLAISTEPYTGFLGWWQQLGAIWIWGAILVPVVLLLELVLGRLKP